MGFARGLLSATETVGTAFWTGASAGYAFIAAPIVAHEANDLDLQARITGTALERIVDAAYVAGGLSIACAIGRTALDGDARPNDAIRAAAGIAALAALTVFRRRILPEMTRLQQAMGGSFKAVPSDDPNRIAYRAAHKASTHVFGMALLLGIGQLALGAVRNPAR